MLHDVWNLEKRSVSDGEMMRSFLSGKIHNHHKPESKTSSPQPRTLIRRMEDSG